ncbi:uncharacterized protein LOC133518388 isoform X2 [Cydia pomonella]|uniref:uncharacterized protein LOC133518388 isoform X2 n=1 Tax=Cydia pomonella TaxID=82600 RepID=UPI002ADD7D88|nr:uncharacterized protein LOC133518388 isoform X2 [Cydia pomonella]
MLALELDALAKFSETSIAAEESAARWYPISRLHSRESVRNTLSDTSPVRYKFRDFSLLTNESVCLATDSTSKDYFRYNKSHGTQFSTSSVRVGASRHEGEVKDTNTKSEGFGNYPPAAPVTVLKRNVKGVWTKFKVTAAGEDQMWLTQLEQPYQAPSEDASGAAGALRGSRSFVQRLLRELIASLPLLPSDANNVKKAKTVRPVKKNRHISGSRSLSSPPSRRSFSVQTLTSTGFQHESSLCETRPTKHDSNNKGKGGVEPGWAGGARALRDAHVRLVLRQLRHVERLNRALDRRAC